MENPKLDRRERRTRQMLTDALIALMQEKRYEAITVQDIIDRADVGRSTFYAHYRDKDDLFASGFQSALGHLLGQIETDSPDDEIVPALALFRHFAEHSRLYHALARGRGLDTLYRAGRAYFVQTVEQRLTRLAGGNIDALTVPLPVLSDYLAGALLNLTQWWFDNRMPYPPERMAEMFERMVLPGVRAALPAAGGQAQRSAEPHRSMAGSTPGRPHDDGEERNHGKH